MSADIRDQLRKIGEVQESTRTPVEFHDLEAQAIIDPAPKRRGWPVGLELSQGVAVMPGPALALVAAIAVLVLFGGLAMLLPPTDPADPVTETTLMTPTTVASDPEVISGSRITSQGSIGLTVDWNLSEDSALLDWGRVADNQGYLAYVEGQYVIPVVDGGRQSDPFQFAVSSDGLGWEVQSLLPDSEIMKAVLADPFFTTRHGNLQIVEHRVEWPSDDGSTPEARYVYHDGTSWHERSYRIDFAVAAVPSQAGEYVQLPSCLNGTVDVLFWHASPPLGVEVVEGLVAVTDSEVVPLPEPPGPGIHCLDNGVFSVDGRDVYQLVDWQWQPFARLPAEQQATWWPADGLYMYRSADELYLTSDFESWETHQLPSVLESLSPDQTVVRRDGLWLVVEAQSNGPRIPTPGTWISENLDDWEFLPSPDFEGAAFFGREAPDMALSAPVHGLVVAVRSNSDPIAPFWVGRVGS